MREWVALTPAQRAKVRDSYKEFNQLDADKKLAVKKKWEAYSNLSEEDKVRARQPKAPPTEATASTISTANPTLTVTTTEAATTTPPSTETAKP
jgi:hypothetical protein